MNKNTIFKEDCRLTLVNPELKFDYCITGQPDFSEIGLNPDKKSDLADYFSFTDTVYTLLSEKCNVFTTVQTDRRSNGLIISKNSHNIQLLLNLGFDVISYKIWVKSEEPRINLYRLNYAQILTFGKKGVKLVKNKTHDFRYDVFNIKHEVVGDFTCGFPEYIVKVCILEYTNPNDSVYDPFIGSGTTGVVSKNLGRFYFGSEISESAITLAEKRINEQQLTLF